MKIIDVIQGSAEWYSAKCGVPSSSGFARIVTTKGKPSEQRTKYLYQLAGEKITGISEETYQSEDMARGKVMEEEARRHYEFLTDTKVKQVGFCIDNDSGSSPDGFVGKSGLLEIKCPKQSTQVGYLLAKVFPMVYFQQTQGQLLVTGRKWVDLMSYYPGMKAFIIRVKPDKEFQRKLKAELIVFCKDLKTIIKKVKQ